jgi:DNA-binding transcriptional LysR family regulator
MISARMDARRLEYFVAVAETLHFRRAAEQLRVAQPALSRQIRRLEADLGCRLLRRDRRGVELTPAGLALLDVGRRALVQMAYAGEAARRTAASQVALLRVGFLSPAAYVVVPAVLHALRQAHPDVYLVLREADSVTLLEELRLGQLDVAFVRGPITWPGVRIDTLLREPLVVALPSGHRLCRRTRVPLAELLDEPFVGFPRATAPALHDAITGLCLAAGFTPAFVAEASEWTTIVSLVAAGMGLTILPDSIRTFTRRGVVYRPIAGRPPHVDLAIGRGHVPPGRALQACLRIVSQVTGVPLV